MKHTLAILAALGLVAATPALAVEKAAEKPTEKKMEVTTEKGKDAHKATEAKKEATEASKEAPAAGSEETKEEGAK